MKLKFNKIINTINNKFTKGFSNILSQTLINLFIVFSIAIILILIYIKYKKFELFNVKKNNNNSFKKNLVQTIEAYDEPPNIQPNNIYQLKNLNSNNCLYNNEDGRFGVSSCNMEWNDQHWKFIPKDSTTFQLKNLNSKNCLLNNKDGRFGVHWCNMEWNDQHWKLIPKDNTTFQLENVNNSNYCLYNNSNGSVNVSFCNMELVNQHWKLINTNHIFTLPSNMQLANVSEDNRSYTSIYNGDAIGAIHASSTLSSSHAWVANINENQSILLNLQNVNSVVGIAIAGRYTNVYKDQYVKSIKVDYIDESSNTKSVDNGRIYNTGLIGDNTEISYIIFTNPVNAKSIIIYPITWNSRYVSMRADLLLSKLFINPILLPSLFSISDIDGNIWKYDILNECIRLKAPTSANVVELNMSIYDDPTVYSTRGPWYGLKNMNSKPGTFIRHSYFVLHSTTFISNDFNFGWRFIKGNNNTYKISNDYNNTRNYAIGYDSTNDKVIIVPNNDTTYSSATNWQIIDKTLDTTQDTTVAPTAPISTFAPTIPNGYIQSLLDTYKIKAQNKVYYQNLLNIQEETIQNIADKVNDTLNYF